MSQTQSSRFYELDVFRGLAALAVVIFHYTSQYATVFYHAPEIWVYFSMGRHGVELFFIISGFVILMTLERTKQGLDFIVSRCARLYPGYWVAIALTFAVVTIANTPKLGVSPLDALANLTMIHGFFGVPNVDDVYWTLQLELCFYVLMFAVYQAKLLKHIEKIALAWLAVAIVLGFKTYTARWGSVVELPEPVLSNAPLMMVSVKSMVGELREFLREFFLFKYAHLFTLGIILYRAKQQGFTALRWGAIALCVLTQKIANPSETSWETTLFVAAFTLLFYLAMQGYLKFIQLKPLIFLGTISYSLYLVHQNIGYSIILALYNVKVNPNISVLIATVISIAIATVITFKIEQPALKWIRKRYENRSQPVANN
jgi:peptidoglycan/LPS O-acetylase OafA/YrhL